jgi:hypothetical protein
VLQLLLLLAWSANLSINLNERVKRALVDQPIAPDLDRSKPTATAKAPHQ